MLNVDSPCPGLHIYQRLATEVPLILARKLADGEVRLLLAGTWSAECYTQDLHLCSTGTRVVRIDAHLARSRLRRRLRQRNPVRNLLDRLLKSVACAEGGNSRSPDLQFLSRLGVPSLPGLALLDGELPEARDLDLLAGLERFGHYLLEGLEVLLGLALGHSSFLCDPLD